MSGIKDRFGRVWDLPRNELCPKCRQPDSCGDCNHQRLTDNDVAYLKGEISEATFLRRQRAEEAVK